MPLLCPSCRVPLPLWSIRPRPQESVCPNCLTGFLAEVFPALFRRHSSTQPAAALDEPAEGLADRVQGSSDEAVAHCYEHVTRIAASACSRCGRFVCSLCEVNLGGEIWCPACLLPKNATPSTPALETQRTLYDSIALILATWPMILIYPTVLTAPVVLFLVVRYWKKPTSLVPRRRWRFLVAALLAIGQLGLFVWIIVFAILAMRRGQ